MFPKWVSKSGDPPHPLEGHLQLRDCPNSTQRPQAQIGLPAFMSPGGKNGWCIFRQMPTYQTSGHYHNWKCIHHLCHTKLLAFYLVLGENYHQFWVSSSSISRSFCFCIYILKKELFREESSKLLFNGFLYSFLPRKTTQVSGQERTLGWNGGSFWHTPGAPHIDTGNFGVLTPILWHRGTVISSSSIVSTSPSRFMGEIRSVFTLQSVQ